MIDDLASDDKMVLVSDPRAGKYSNTISIKYINLPS